MRKNIFTKSMLRQPMRTALLVALVAASAFAFIMHAVEYIVVKGQIAEISKYYRAVGYLHGDRAFLENVSAVACHAI